MSSGSTRRRRFRQVDVFSATPYRGNPVAVVLDADDVTTEEMQEFASWTNLSETTYVLAVTDAAADYRVRIFTPTFELPFAGHPTLGTCHAWLAAGGSDLAVLTDRTAARVIVQECGIGLVRVRAGVDGSLAFAAPALIRSGDLDDETLRDVVRILGIERSDVLAAQWVDNGPGWIGVLLSDAEAVLALRPGPVGERLIGVVGASPAHAGHAFEVRAFFPVGSLTAEDPVTGSLNASLAQWLVASGIAPHRYRARQGTVLGRAGFVEIEAQPGGEIWVGGACTTCIEGTVLL
jgi:PhzF family phenazine biosynthesis protein